MRWGSLPNLVGMTFFLCAVRCLMLPTGRGPVVLLALYVAAIMVTHHLSALIFG